ncbi:MAG: hypothetical protein K1000chlam1_01437, partial [Candidatus Anoxychlamydiales bacterium]|nr:hypothetical protein [Candidatus Anoxychlamydiales bacterium]
MSVVGDLKSCFANMPDRSSFLEDSQGYNFPKLPSSSMNGIIYKSPFDTSIEVTRQVYEAQMTLLDSMDKVLNLSSSIPPNTPDKDEKLFKDIFVQEIKRINLFFSATHWQFLDNIIFSDFWIKYNLLQPSGLFLIEKIYHVAKNALLNAIPTIYNRANEYFNFSTGYFNITQKEQDILAKLLQRAWQKHKKDFKEEDIADISVFFTISDTRPARCYGISFDVIVRQTDQNGKVRLVHKCLYSATDHIDPELRAFYLQIDWLKFNKTYSKKELEILKSSEKSKKSSMNCWDHAAIGAILLDKSLMRALISLEGKGELEKPALDDKIDRLKEDCEDLKNFSSLYASTISAENRSKYLIDCIFACLYFKDDLEKQKKVIERYSPFIRKYTFGLIDER